MIASI